MERIDDGKIECKLEEITTLSKRRHARVSLVGTVRGVNEDGPNKQQLDGYYYFDLESNHVSYLSIKGVSFLLDKEGKELGQVEGRFVLTRQARRECKELSDQALRGVELEPTADNTLLLYDNPDLGVRFLHPRRWRVGVIRGRQLALDEAGGSGLLLTLELANKTPTGAQFLKESQDWLALQKAKVLKSDGPRQVQGPKQTTLENFSLEVEMGGQRYLLDYYVSLQKNGGATLAARLHIKESAELRKELDRIARSVILTQPVK